MNGRRNGRSDAETRAIRKRLDEIAGGLEEGIRREVARRRRLGLPVYVAENGYVVDASKPREP